MFKVVAKNTLAQIAGKITTILLSIVTTALLARFLGRSGYGEYTFIISFVLLFGNISDWGTNMITVREAAKDKINQPVIFGNSAVFRLILSLFSIILLNMAVHVNPNWQSLVQPTTIASFVLLGLSLKTSALIVFQTLLKFENATVVEILSSAIFLLGVLLITNKSGLTGVMFVWVIATFIAAALGIYFAKRLSPISLKVDWKVIKTIFLEAIPTGALLITFTIYNRIDMVILQSYQGSDAVGVYGLSYKIHDNLVFGAAFLMNSLFPFYAKQFSNGDKLELKNCYQKTFDVLLTAAIFIIVLTFVFAPLMIQIIGGPEFTQSVGVLRILIFATFISYFNHLTGYSLIAFGKQRTSLVIAIAALFFNIVFNLLFVPKYSYNASAVITIATEGLVLLLSSIAIWKSIKVVPSLFLFPKTIADFVRTRNLL